MHILYLVMRALVMLSKAVTAAAMTVVVGYGIHDFVKSQRKRTA